MAMADVFVLPSIHDDSGNVDGLPNTLLEAMASARPVVATTVGGVPAAITHGTTGLLVPERSSPALAEAIVAILDSGDRGERMGLAAREAIRWGFTWTDVARRFERLYDAACDRR
jgi:glycosyltransferase involved in cell wall biosynthesis